MKTRITYLDDEIELLSIFQEILANEDIEIQTFSDPNLAIKKINETLPDLVFLDYRLPNTTGDKVALSLPKQIPKVLLTGDLLIKPEARFMRVMQKPFQFAEIEKIILEARVYQGNQKAS